MATAPIRVTAGDVIRRKRIEAGFSQRAIARVAGITQTALSNYERGKRDMPLGTFVRIADCLGHPASIPVLLAEIVNESNAKTVAKR